MEDLTGRTALITGASSGLGRHFAHLLSSRGATCILAARRKELVEAECAAILTKGGQALAVRMDVADEASVRAAYDATEAKFGLVDTIIANAGMNIEGPALEIDATALDEILAVNVRGTFLTIREGARRLISAKSDRGRVIVISSITAQSVSPGLSLYSASKAAVLQMSKVLARDWANKGININVICPGYIETDLNADWFGTEGGQRQIAKWPRHRLMDKGSLDGLVTYLASDASAYTTGSVFTVDDGQTLAG